jgi:hypothetical protein
MAHWVHLGAFLLMKASSELGNVLFGGTAYQAMLELLEPCPGLMPVLSVSWTSGSAYHTTPNKQCCRVMG